MIYPQIKGIQKNNNTRKDQLNLTSNCVPVCVCASRTKRRFTGLSVALNPSSSVPGDAWTSILNLMSSFKCTPTGSANLLSCLCNTCTGSVMSAEWNIAKPRQTPPAVYRAGRRHQTASRWYRDVCRLDMKGNTIDPEAWLTSGKLHNEQTGDMSCGRAGGHRRCPNQYWRYKNIGPVPWGKNHTCCFSTDSRKEFWTLRVT